MEITGKIKQVGDVEHVSEKFQKRLVVIETDEQYPQVLAIEFVQDKVDLPDGYGAGDLVTVGINLRGREWNGKFFTNLQGWRITGDTVEVDTSREVELVKEHLGGEVIKDDDLPF